jgi:hypothetical protein
MAQERTDMSSIYFSIFFSSRRCEATSLRDDGQSSSSTRLSPGLEKESG